MSDPVRRSAWAAALASAVLLASCAGSVEPPTDGACRDPGGCTSGGGGASGSGGASTSSGGTSGGAASSGGTSGATSSGGASSGATSSGGTSGGATSSGGTSGGGTSSGGTSSGGTSSGATSSGGTSGGGTSGGGTSGGGTSSGGEPVVDHPRRVLLSDEGNGRVLLVDLLDPGKAVWSRTLDHPRDLQLVGGGRVAVSTATGYVELDLATGAVRKEVGGFASVETLRRLPDGSTILGANVGGGVTLQELDRADAPVAAHRVTFAGYGPVRLMRRTPRGTFLLGVGTKVAEVGWSAPPAWEMVIPDGSSVFQAVHLADGTVAVSSGYGAAILVVDPATKRVLRTIGGKAQPDAATLLPNFYAGFQILRNGHFVVTNWEGHGGGNGGKGFQLLEYDASGLLVWKWKQDPGLVSSLHDVIVLDGLDVAVLHDDAGGVLAPVTG